MAAHGDVIAALLTIEENSGKLRYSAELEIRLAKGFFSCHVKFHCCFNNVFGCIQAKTVSGCVSISQMESARMVLIAITPMTPANLHQQHMTSS